MRRVREAKRAVRSSKGSQYRTSHGEVSPSYSSTGRCRSGWEMFVVLLQASRGKRERVSDQSIHGPRALFVTAAAEGRASSCLS